MKVEIKEHKNLARDTSTMAVINTDRGGRKQALAARRKKMQDQAEMNQLKEDVATLKDLVSQLLAKLG